MVAFQLVWGRWLVHFPSCSYTKNYEVISHLVHFFDVRLTTFSKALCLEQPWGPGMSCLDGMALSLER